MSRDRGIKGRIDAPVVCAPEAARGSTAPRIFILSNVKLYREGLALSLSQRPELDVVGDAALSAAALAQVASAAPAVVLLDFTTTGALNLPKELNRLIPGIKIIAFAVSDADHDLLACAESGVAGFVTHDGSIDDLVASIRSALHDEAICPPRVVGLLFKRVAALSHVAMTLCSASTLTPREREVIELIDEGLSNKEIARSLRITSATVKNHVHNILEKLQVSRRGEAAARLRAIVLGEPRRVASPARNRPGSGGR